MTEQALPAEITLPDAIQPTPVEMTPSPVRRDENGRRIPKIVRPKPVMLGPYDQSWDHRAITDDGDSYEESNIFKSGSVDTMEDDGVPTPIPIDMLPGNEITLGRPQE